MFWLHEVDAFTANVYFNEHRLIAYRLIDDSSNDSNKKNTVQTAILNCIITYRSS